MHSGATVPCHFFQYRNKKGLFLKMDFFAKIFFSSDAFFCIDSKNDTFNTCYLRKMRSKTQKTAFFGDFFFMRSGAVDVF